MDQLNKFITIFYLEMLDPLDLISGREPLVKPEIRLFDPPDWNLNKELYEKIGKDWNWTDKLSWTNEEWITYTERPELKTYLAWNKNENIVGYVELEIQDEGNIQISYFGLMPEFTGKGLGAWFLCETVKIAWLLKAKRVWVHTCSQDHPNALPNYIARGFKLYKEEKKMLQVK